jgi:hypothetical protein
MLAYRDGKLCLIYETQENIYRTIPLEIGFLKDDSADRSDYLKGLEKALNVYSDQVNNQDSRKISEIEIAPRALTNYPTVKQVWQVRELFIRIFDLLGFTVLRSDNIFPEFVLLFGDISYNATVVVKASDCFDKIDQVRVDCDLVICWDDDLEYEPDEFEILAISKFFDVLST